MTEDMWNSSRHHLKGGTTPPTPVPLHAFPRHHGIGIYIDAFYFLTTAYNICMYLPPPIDSVLSFFGRTPGHCRSSLRTDRRTADRGAAHRASHERRARAHRCPLASWASMCIATKRGNGAVAATDRCDGLVHDICWVRREAVKVLVSARVSFCEGHVVL